MSRAFTAIAAAAAAAIGLVAVLATSRPPQTGASGSAAEAVYGEADRAELAGWRESGFVRRISEESHEVWIDGDLWRGLTRAEREARVKVLSSYFRSVDGTRQVMVREWGSGAGLADFFADVFRTE